MKKQILPNILRAPIAAAIALALPHSLYASDWTGTNANWSSNGNPGWNGTGVPDGVGSRRQSRCQRHQYHHGG